jgi:phenylacetate-CoA ligase
MRDGMLHSREQRFIRDLHKNPPEKIKEYQLQKLTDLIYFSYNNVPYYHNLFNRLGLKPFDIRSFEDFEKIPILTRSSLRNYADKLLALGAEAKKLIRSGTGGTTDSPITFYYDSRRAKIKEAEMDYFRTWFRWEPADKVAYVWGAPQDIPNISGIKYRVVNRLTYNTLFLFSSYMNPRIMDEYIDRLNSFRPDILQGYANALFILARYILEKGYAVPSPKSIVITAEPCLPYQRGIIESAFRSEVFTFYGCREAGYVGCECSRHLGYHINCSSLYLEFLTDRGRAKPGEIGRIILTDLFNYDMPFIRYEIGDLGIPSDSACTCGSQLPLMQFFAGRETDVFVTPDGDLVPGVSLTSRIIESCRGIEKLQFIQNTRNELIVRIVKGKDYSVGDMEKLDRKLWLFFKGKLKITKEFMEDIPREKSGKTRFCISRVDKGIKADRWKGMPIT